MTDYFNGRITYQLANVTIASSASTSSTFTTNGGGLVGLVMPAAFTGTTMTFNGSDDGASFLPIYNANGTAFSITVATSRIILFSPGDFIGLQFIQFVSGSTEGGARTLGVVSRSLA